MFFRRSKSVNFTEGQKLTYFSGLILIVGLVASIYSDLSIYTTEPLAQISLIFDGFLDPELFSLDKKNNFQLLKDIVYTLSFALLGVICSVFFGFFLSHVYQITIVRLICALFRAIHELFWALIFIQIFGLSANTAILAITIPYACTFARVFNDIYLHAELKSSNIWPDSSNRIKNKNSISLFIYLTLPQVWPAMRDYIRYRFECGIRTSAVLGFVGLPTIGFHLETAFKQANYSFAAALLLVFFALIGTIKYWLKDYMIPLFVLLAWWFLPTNDFTNSNENIIRFFTQDIWPRISQEEGLMWWQSINSYFVWAIDLFKEQAIGGIINTILLTLMAVSLTGLVCFLTLPFLVKFNRHKLITPVNQLALLLMRSTPEYILAFILLLFFGPSMLPAVLALTIHNCGLIQFLMLRRANNLLKKRQLFTISISQYFYQIQPKIYPPFLALLLYRAEIILRESAILGILGITTLGFYIDSAFEDLRFDRALLLLLITAILNVLLDQLARKVQMVVNHQDILVKSRR